MTVQDIFYNCNTSYPSIRLYDSEHMQIFCKEPKKVLGRCEYLHFEVAWIDEISSKEIRLRINA